MSDFVFCSGFLVVGGFMDRAGVLVFQFGVLLDCVFTSYWWLPPPMWVAVVDVYVFVCGCWRFQCDLSNNRGFQALKLTLLLS